MTENTIAQVIRIVRATRADALADDLAREMARSSDVCDECFVVVQGPGMANWLRTAMVARCGAWGGVESPFLREVLQLMGGRAAGKPAPERGREPQRELAYRIVACVARAHAAGGALRDRLAPLIEMCADANGGLDLSTLLVRARTIAECFDRLEMDRPQLIEAWEARDAPWHEAGKSPSAEAAALEEWQRALWRATVPGKWEPHDRWNDLRSLIARLKRGELPAGLKSLGFVSLFGVSTVPPLAMELLAALAKHRPVSVHMLVPTMQLQEHGVSAREVARAAVREGTSSEELREREVREEGNPLVATLGALALEAAVVVDRFDEAAVIDATDGSLDGAATREPFTVLGEIQQAMADHRPCTSDPSRAAGDASLRFHGVTTVTRAAEVAYDEILRAFAEIPGLRQEDVIILTPDLAAHAAAMEAAFRERASRDSVQPRLLLRVADRSSGACDGVATVVDLLMQLALEDQSVAQVRAIIEHPVVVRGLGLSAGDVCRVLDALVFANAARFLDSETRAIWLGIAAPDDAIHTIGWAVDRLVLGMATGSSPASDHPIGMVLPADSPVVDLRRGLRIVGGALDALAEFVRATQRGAQPLEAWTACVSHALDSLAPSVDDAEFGDARMGVEEQLKRLGAAATDSELPSLDWLTARAEISGVLGSLAEGRYYAAGGVTLARMAPMRSVPFRVVILVGIEHGVFPRSVRREALDLAALAPRAGDRNARAEDQLLILEALHAAGDRLIVIHRDREATTGERVAEPAVLVEIRDAAIAAMGIDEDEGRRALSISHAGLADAPEEWSQDARVGFDVRARARAAEIVRGDDRAARRFPKAVAAAAAIAAASNRRADASTLGAQLCNPAKAYLQARGITPPDPSTYIDPVCEVQELNKLDEWGIDQFSIEAARDGLTEAAALANCERSGLLPHGGGGRGVWAAAWATAALIAAEAKSAEDGGVHAILIERDKPHREIPAWIEYLEVRSKVDAKLVVLIAYERGSRAKPQRLPLRSLSPADAAKVLDEVRDLLVIGRRELLPFHARLLGPWRKRNTSDAAIAAEQLRKAFEEAYLGPTIADDLHLRLAFRGAEFFQHGRESSTPKEPRSFEHIAAWIQSQMDHSGWNMKGST